MIIEDTFLDTQKYAVIVAGGFGKRMNSTIPKQFILLKGKPVLYYTINTFLNSFNNINIILVLPKNYIREGEKIMHTFFCTKKITITEGGATRFHSVKNGLQHVQEDSIVFVHDSARALVTQNLIHRCYNQAIKIGSAIPSVVCKDSTRLLTTEGHTIIDRNAIRLIQTPQTFQSNILLPAFNVNYTASFTDEASVVEAYGANIELITGEETNIKITTPMDLYIAEKILENQIVKK